MKKYAVLLVVFAAVIGGCKRKAEVNSTDFFAEPTAAAAAKVTSQIYTVDEYDPARDVDADLLETVKQAKKGNKRIILEIGGHW
ncbi:MAG: hypothetical protein P8L85_08435 [Rubripirellula sp.]|nr:hypothetical protein [Rubripirellula sp.]